MHDHAQVLQDGPLEGRVLPKALGITTGGARRFWRTWATSPQTAGWAETDWAELEITTKLVDAFYQGDTRHASEIRMRTAKWGGTVEDRARLRMTLELPENNDQDQDQDAMTVAADMDEELYRLLSGG